MDYQNKSFILLHLWTVSCQSWSMRVFVLHWFNTLSQYTFFCWDGQQSTPPPFPRHPHLEPFLFIFIFICLTPEADWRSIYFCRVYNCVVLNSHPSVFFPIIIFYRFFFLLLLRLWGKSQERPSACWFITSPLTNRTSTVLSNFTSCEGM